MARGWEKVACFCKQGYVTSGIVQAEHFWINHGVSKCMCVWFVDLKALWHLRQFASARIRNSRCGKPDRSDSEIRGFTT